MSNKTYHMPGINLKNEVMDSIIIVTYLATSFVLLTFGTLVGYGLGIWTRG